MYQNLNLSPEGGVLFIVLAGACMSIIVTNANMFEPLRKSKIITKKKFLKELFSCVLCFGVWTTALCAGLYFIPYGWILMELPIGGVIGSFILSKI